jgi:PAS domain S-box-containing protein
MIDVSFSAEPIDLDGVAHLLVSIWDVTAETRARAAEERLAKFFGSSPSAHAISRLEDGCYIEVNDAYVRMFGYARDELVGHTSLELRIWPDCVERARFVEAVAAAGRVDRFPAKARRKGGEVFDMLVSAELIDLDGVRHALVSVEDVTAMVKGRDELERHVRERTAELVAANRELEAFSYSVSHDMRSPIRAIAAFSGILLGDHSGELSTEARRLLERIAASAEHMGALIDALLELSRLMRRPLQRERVDLSAVAERLLRETAGRSPDRVVRTVVQPGLSAVADGVLLRSVLENLIGNAWKYTAKTPGASIEFGREGGEFYVRDNGVGFDMTYSDKLFKPFERLHSAEEFPGTGIGLATVDRILRRHGGRTRAEGAPGGGATIYFTLPE